MAVLSPDDIKARLQRLPGWALAGGELEKTYTFGEFTASMAFVNQVAAIAEAANHHPDIRIAYSRVTLTLSTHSEGGITEKDFSVIERIEQTTGPARGGSGS
jgi:4a-hydroxytetrahydrobiopterin dehydratase